MNKKDFLERYLNGKPCVTQQICATCPNKCCERSACDALPIDIEPFTAEHIIKLIDDGVYSISVRFPRVNEVFACLQSREIESDVFHINKTHHRCSLLGKSGCTLNEDERPTYALLLIPDERYQCRQLIPHDTLRDQWITRSDVMKEVIEHYSDGKSMDDLIIGSFQELAEKFYEKLINNYSFDHWDELNAYHARMYEFDLYDEIMKIAFSNSTMDQSIETIVNLFFSDSKYESKVSRELLFSKCMWSVSKKQMISNLVNYNKSHISTT